VPNGPHEKQDVIIDDPKITSSREVFVGPNRENICAILVTYFPDARFVERLDRIRQQVARVLIVDNTADAKRGASSQQLGGTEIEIIQNKENLGIGAALNQGLARAIQLGYKWAITLDQDSWVHSDLVTALIGICEQQPQPELVGIIGCNFEDENIHMSPIKYQIDGPSFSEVKTVITSGSLVSAAIFSAAGPFRSDFFIDFIDHEYCLRLRKLGYKVIIANAPLMVHALGAPTTLGFDNGVGKFSLVLTNRSPLRRYYITRNGLLLAKTYFTVAPTWALRTLASVLGFALLKIPLEKAARWKKFCATIYGALDALRSRTGQAKAGWLKE
jgi:rhamnosyltransferase